MESAPNNLDYLTAVLRPLLTSLGGMLAAKGLIAGDQVQTIVSALIVIAGVIWSVLHHSRMIASHSDTAVLAYRQGVADATPNQVDPAKPADVLMPRQP